MFCIEVRSYSELYKEKIIQLTFKIGKEFDIPIFLKDQPDLLDIPYFYQNGLGNFWIALDGEQVVGTIALIDIGNNQGTVRKVFVDNEYRGNEKKTSKCLLDALMDWCKHKNIHEIFLGTRAVFLAPTAFMKNMDLKKFRKIHYQKHSL